MEFRARTVLTFLVTAMLTPVAGEADSYRCGRKIVRTGDTVSKLLQVCGEPRLKSSGSSAIKLDGVHKKARVKRWHYKKGSRSLEYIVMIYEGKIAAIEVGGR